MAFIPLTLAISLPLIVTVAHAIMAIGLKAVAGISGFTKDEKS
ncbi:MULTISPECIES: hypothetical protein [unclassified Microcoleus]|nr:MULTISPECIES: hypothetical protein [unclassified Microcoleus]